MLCRKDDVLSRYANRKILLYGTIDQKMCFKIFSPFKGSKEEPRREESNDARFVVIRCLKEGNYGL
jgi:hypothetical protein